MPTQLEQAIEYHQSGFPDKAEAIYKKILKDEPKNFDAMHLLGVIDLDRGQTEPAKKLVLKALSIEKNFPNAYYTLGRIYERENDYKKSYEAYNQAIKLAPDFSVAHHGLGTLSMKLGDFAKAAEYFRKQLEKESNNANTWCDLAMALQNLGLDNDAREAFDNSLKLQPENKTCLNNYSIFEIQRKSPQRAIELLSKLLEIDPHFKYAWNNIGLAYQLIGEMFKAEECFYKALDIDAHFHDSTYNIAKLYHDMGRINEAIKLYKKLVSDFPDNENYTIALGIILTDNGKLDEAEQCYNDFLKRCPNQKNYSALRNLSVIHRTRQDLDLAEKMIREAMAMNPDDITSYNTLGWILHDANRFEEAEEVFREGLAKAPNDQQLRSNLLILLTYRMQLSHDKIFEEHCNFGNIEKPQDIDQLPPMQNDLSPYRKLRIGYISPDFKRHVVRNFIQPIIQKHNRNKVEVFCYASVQAPDDVTEIIKPLPDHWRPIFHLSDREAAEQIRNDKIDVLIELSGHTAANRLGVMFYKPAPVQVSYLGYITTTGLKEIDYRITDYVMNPIDTQEHFTEKLYRLDRCYKTYEAAVGEPDVNPQVTKGKNITFCSLHRISKITEPSIELWSEVLKALPESKLLFARHELMYAKNQTWLYKSFEKYGISKDQLLMDDTSSYNTHMEIYQNVDISLDPTPVVGGATTAEALWMGVPTLTLQGEAFRERISSSILHAIGLSDWIATNKDEYIKKAVYFAENYNLRLRLRNELRELFLKSELGNASDLANTLENAYIDMWHRYVSNTK